MKKFILTFLIFNLAFAENLTIGVIKKSENVGSQYNTVMLICINNIEYIQNITYNGNSTLIPAIDKYNKPITCSVVK